MGEPEKAREALVEETRRVVLSGGNRVAPFVDALDAYVPELIRAYLAALASSSPPAPDMGAEDEGTRQVSQEPALELYDPPGMPQPGHEGTREREAIPDEDEYLARIREALEELGNAEVNVAACYRLKEQGIRDSRDWNRSASLRDEAQGRVIELAREFAMHAARPRAAGWRTDAIPVGALALVWPPMMDEPVVKRPGESWRAGCPWMPISPLAAAPSPATGASEPKCRFCGKPATCLGSYNDEPRPTYACDDCCAHGNEDGHCEPVAPDPAMGEGERLTGEVCMACFGEGEHIGPGGTIDRCHECYGEGFIQPPAPEAKP